MATKQEKVTASKVRALSLHIGLNAVSASDYGGWTGPLAACEFDANDRAALARGQGMKASPLLTKKGTRANALAGIRAAAKALRSGDLFLLTYSGHGGQVPDVSGEETAALSNLGVSSGRVSAIVRKFRPSVILISGCQDNQTSPNLYLLGAVSGFIAQRPFTV